MSQRFLIVTFFFFFALGALALFWQNQEESAPGHQKDWWLVAFTEPANAKSADFRIENYTDNEDFTYRILRDNILLEEHPLTVPADQTRAVPVGIPVEGTITIEVTHGPEKKSIYRQ